MQKILNETRGFYLKRSAAERAIEECTAEWVVEGISIRSLTLAEVIAARKRKAFRCEPLAFAELPGGYRFIPPASGVEATRRSGRLIKEANQFARRGGTSLKPFLQFERPLTARLTPDRACLVA